jgi:hypothetical protein
MNFNEKFKYINGELIWKVTLSNRAFVGKKAGSFRKDGYTFVCVNKKRYGIHQIIFAMHNGYIPKEIDHIDGNPSNNKIENLREANRAENAQNQKLTSKNKSGVKGVSWHKGAKKWVVQLMSNRVHKYIGLFEDLELAELVSIEAKDKYHKEFACHG